MTSPRTPVADQITNLLDGGFERAARGVLRAMAAEVEGGIVAQRLNELEAEAARLEQAGERLRPDNPVLRALLADLETSLQANQRRMTDAASSLTEEGAAASGQATQLLTFAGMDDQTVSSIQGVWNRPDPQAVAALVDFTSDPAWDEMLTRYGDYILERLNNKALYGFTQGWGAVRTAEELARLANGMTVREAETILRTLYLQSYRRGTAATQAANAAILEPTATRVAVLDRRTCLACVALHGTEIPLGQPVKDHWNGRCTSIARVRGITRNITRGVDWFNSLPEERQAEQEAFRRSPGAFDAFKAGAVRLDDFAAEATDTVFGEMVVQASLQGILGEDARKWYRR